ncbi:MAG: glutamate--tRNA ligase [Candidatus Kerfeldbacteria bacterium]|nr:glutamate--tRNA ligase [Candidatus Kerfeldbacteria bacterium]
MTKSAVRVRLAPSPTGEVHIGTIWLAQFNWLFAQQNHGAFILRVEDTDQKRFVPGSMDRIYEALHWFGLDPDEGPQQGGGYGPYVQSQRLKLYRHHADELVQRGAAYPCFCTIERLQKLRTSQEERKLPPRYDKLCLGLPPEERAKRLAAEEPNVIRLNVPMTGTITHRDLIRGPVTFSFATVDDSVLLKSDGFPTYHLAVVVDDHLMAISHVIRGEEWLPSTPKHLLIYQALEWVPPLFAHVPLILGPDHRKLSKREGASSALSFRDQGYLAAAMRNFLALMGWHPKGELEILSSSDLQRDFRLEDMNPSGAVFDRTKLDWMNGQYLRRLSREELRQHLQPFWHLPTEEGSDDQHVLAIIDLVRDRLKKLSDIDEVANFLFPSVWDQERTHFDRVALVPKKGTGHLTTAAIDWVTGVLDRYAGPWTSRDIKAHVLAEIQAKARTNTEVLWPLRVALTLRPNSPDVFDVLDCLGKPESMRRLRLVNAV